MYARVREVIPADMARVDEEGLDLKEINGTQQRPTVPATRWERQRKTRRRLLCWYVYFSVLRLLTATKLQFTGQVKLVCCDTTAATATATAATDRTARTGTATAATATATPMTTDLPLAQAAAKRPAATKPIQATKATPETFRPSSPRTAVAPAKVARAPRAAS
ncbi:hypothetical protein PHYSODRAFT_306577 [Phytophthora sojae]|uniref:Uncharacterized protein n=1 Tax=Phytophthora sojae (strain P6497) TaxID=1094619 RepID=G5A9V1_PHYSP|nr:hypothetical protein PHYSODRAFT_306577 [Phytophthora sojae]EGZ07381.1 hypothetical protein PHYSODRAFT_306577 [Phytophthora sojae]|eukprot:XP_009536947.1 hypothetical protein PHYSODRAFT_306577 [Phytophthora sojae]